MENKILENLKYRNYLTLLKEGQTRNYRCSFHQRVKKEKNRKSDRIKWEEDEMNGEVLLHRADMGRDESGSEDTPEAWYTGTGTELMKPSICDSVDYVPHKKIHVSF